jgi:hypothetical protein
MTIRPLRPGHAQNPDLSTKQASASKRKPQAITRTLADQRVTGVHTLASVICHPTSYGAGVVDLPSDRCVSVGLHRLSPGIVDLLSIVRPETVNPRPSRLLKKSLV